MVTFSYDNLVKITSDYKKEFAKRFPGEVYKWKAVKHFQEHWDIYASDFKGMLRQALSYGKKDNLLTSMQYFPKTMLEKFCDINSDQVRDMFLTLYDERKGLDYRINYFTQSAKDLLKQWNKGKMHYQDFRAITTYLWLRYPDKYYIYKCSCAKALAERLDSSYIPKKGIGANGVVEVFRLYDDVSEYLLKDSELRMMLDEVLTDDCYRDNRLRTLVVDLAYFAGEKSKMSQLFKIAGKKGFPEMPVADTGMKVDKDDSSKEVNKYTKEDFLKEVYMSGEDYDALKYLVETKKNVILQGAPGVGKTFCARRLAWSMMGVKDESRVAFVQFHQSYSYEDFVMGYKPKGNAFDLREGLFYKFCVDAASHKQQKYFFIIDEINRGNLSKIFGELLMLIENWHRGDKITLAYRDEKFSVPENIYIIGMMNTADRSLALIDYALRRRFGFFGMRPSFDTDGFKAYQQKNGNAVFDALVELIKELNEDIANDDSLGESFEIGHSYLCTEDGSMTHERLKSVVSYDIIPMLQEYWFDNKEKMIYWSKKLKGIFHD